MCYDADARPPIHGEPLTTIESTPLTLISGDGTRFAAFLARPARASGLGVVVLPDNRGLHAFYEDLAYRLAGQGHCALAIDYYGRSDGVNRNRPDDFPVMRHVWQLTKAGIYGDIGTAIDHLRPSCRAVLALGFCLGGRFAFLAAAPEFGLAGAVGFYGATMEINGAPGPTQLAEQGRLSAPILGIFGGADEGLPPHVVAEFDKALTTAGVEHDIVTYPGAPHGFFDVHQQDHAEASADAWARTLGFINSR